MKHAIAAVIIACMVGVGAYAQFTTAGLVEFARQERERRAEGEPARRVITTDNVSRTGPPMVLGQVGQVTPEETTPAPSDVQVELADPAAAIGQQQRVVQDLEDQEVRLQLEINRFRGQFTAPVVSQADRNAAVAGMDAAEANLENVRTRLTEARETLVLLQQAAAEAAEASARASTTP